MTTPVTSPISRTQWLSLYRAISRLARTHGTSQGPSMRELVKQAQTEFRQGIVVYRDNGDIDNADTMREVYDKSHSRLSFARMQHNRLPVSSSQGQGGAYRRDKDTGEWVRVGSADTSVTEVNQDGSRTVDMEEIRSLGQVWS